MLRKRKIYKGIPSALQYGPWHFKLTKKFEKLQNLFFELQELSVHDPSFKNQYDDTVYAYLHHQKAKVLLGSNKRKW